MNIPEDLAEENILQIQLLRGLSATLPSKMTHNEIITSDAVYETAHSILSRGMNEVSSRVLGFLSASLRAAARAYGPVRECAARARKLLLRSGCLQDMVDMFLNSMPNSENWKVLCECLVESCKDCEENQNFCSCLIPECVRRCNCHASNMEMFMLLRCLLTNNSSNIDRFVECNGTSIFTKDSIHDSSKMELLAVVVQNSSAANLLRRDLDLLNSLVLMGDNYEVNCEGSWEMVEWASVILFHLASHIEGVDSSIGTSFNITDFDNDIKNSETTLKDLTVSFLFKPKWENAPKNVFKHGNIQNQTDGHELESSTATQSFCFNPISEDQMSIRLSTNFLPKFMSTPKRRITKTNERIVELRKEVTPGTMPKSNHDSQRKGNSASLIKKTLSTSARIVNIVNNSCISIYHTMETIFGRKLTDAKSQISLKQDSISKLGLIKLNAVMKKKCFHNEPNDSTNLKAPKLKQKLAFREKYRRRIVKKLKTGMHFYGCNFKKIAQVMWSHQKEITPRVLYSIYRKYVVKRRLSHIQRNLV